MKQLTQEPPKATFKSEVDRLLDKLSELDPNSKEYGEIVKHLEILCTARAHKGNDRPSIDMMLSVGANLIGIVMILNFERTNILTSKAISSLFKGR